MLFSDYPEIGIFEDGLSELGIKLSDLQIQQFIDYYELLVEKNNIMNLTAITEFKEVVQKHFIDSLSLVRVLSLKNEKILDLGTGAGFPGIPLKIVFPEVNVLLLDSLNKRLIFLNEVIEKLKLDKITTLHGRAEDFGRDALYREQFDLCVSRAVAKLSSLSEYCLPFVKKGGYFIAYKSGNIDNEIIESKRAFKILGSKVEKIDKFNLSGTEMERSFIVLRKTEATPKGYPRSAGKPSKDPL